jgi:hypothetical protein
VNHFPEPHIGMGDACGSWVVNNKCGLSHRLNVDKLSDSMNI